MSIACMEPQHCQGQLLALYCCAKLIPQAALLLLQTLNNAKGQLVRQAQLVHAERSRAGSAQQHAQTVAAEARKAQAAVQRQHDADMAQAIDEATRLRVSALYTGLAGAAFLCLLRLVQGRHVAALIHLHSSCQATNVSQEMPSIDL